MKDELYADLAEIAANNGHVPRADPSYRSTRLADVQAERVRWLWPRRLPRGKLVTLDGDPDVGKSTLALDFAARLTTAEPFPGEDLACVPHSHVVLMAAEDGLADTIRPRLDAAGADPARVHHLDAAGHLDDEGNVIWAPPSIPEDVAALEALIVETGAVLAVVDVLMAYLSGRMDSYRDQHVRHALLPLAEMADRTGACVVLLRHLRKSRGAALYAGGGSIGIVGQVRSGMMAAADPDDETGRHRVLARTKGNLAEGWPSLAYTIEADDPVGPTRVEWHGESDKTADALMAHTTDDERSALEEAVEWLESMLAKEASPRREVIKQARTDGIAEMTLRRAALRLKVVSERDESQQGRPATWRLPGFGSRVSDQEGMNRNPLPSDQEKQPESLGFGSTSVFEPKPDRCTLDTPDYEADYPELFATEGEEF